MENTPPLVLSISGSDPSGGAGLEADLKTFQRHGVYGMAVPTLLTVQNTTGVRRVKFLEPDFLADQIDFLLEDLFPAVIKIGAVGSQPMLRALVRLLSQERLRGAQVVVDTVLSSTSGTGLFDMNGLEEFVERLLPLATLVTPNIPEFEMITGKSVDAGNAAAHLLAFGRGKRYSILLKGGHLAGDPTDFLLHAGAVKKFSAPRIDTPHTHGTGCALASSIAANLALGHGIPEAVARGREYVRRAIAGNPGLGKGRGPLGFDA